MRGWMVVMLAAVGCGFHPHQNYVDLLDGGGELLSDDSDASPSDSLPADAAEASGRSDIAAPDSYLRRDVAASDLKKILDAGRETAPGPEAGPEAGREAQPDAWIAPDIVVPTPEVEPPPATLRIDGTSDLGEAYPGRPGTERFYTVVSTNGSPTGALRVSVDTPDVAITTNTCAQLFAGGQSCRIGLTLSPANQAPPGSISATLTVTGTGCVTSVTVNGLIREVPSPPPEPTPDAGSVDARDAWAGDVESHDAVSHDTKHCFKWVKYDSTACSSTLGFPYWFWCAESIYGCCTDCPPDGADAGID